MMVEPTTAFCPECKATREMGDAEEVEMPGEGGKSLPALKGTCPICGSALFVLLDGRKPSV